MEVSLVVVVVVFNCFVSLAQLLHSLALYLMQQPHSLECAIVGASLALVGLQSSFSGNLHNANLRCYGHCIDRVGLVSLHAVVTSRLFWDV